MTTGADGTDVPAGHPGPDFLVIGAARSGTTALCALLGTHPEVRITSPKEPHFLALHHLGPAAFTGPGDAYTINRVAVTDSARWLALLGPADGPLRGEGSVSTLYYAHSAVPTIQQFCPQARLIVLLRQPAERAHSAHLYQTGRGWETESFARALTLEPERIAAGWHHLWHYRRMGFYAEQLAPFVSSFGRERLLVLDHARFEADPEETARRCARHLDLDPAGFSLTTARVNEGALRPRPILALERAVRRSQLLGRAVRTFAPKAVRERVRAAGSTRAVLDPALKDELDAGYVDDARRLAALLGEDTPEWCRALV